MSSYQDFIQTTLASKTNESKVNQLIASHTDVTSKAKQDDMDLILETDTDNQNRRILKKGGTGILNTIQNDVDLLNEKTTNITYDENTENNTTKTTISGVLSLPNHDNVDSKLTDIATDISDVNTSLLELNTKTTNISYDENTDETNTTTTNTTIAGDKVTISGVLSLPNHDDVDLALTNLENNNTQSTNDTSLTELNKKTNNISYEDTDGSTTITGDTTITGVLSLPSHTDVNTSLTDIAADISDVNTSLLELNTKTTNISYEDTDGSTTIAGDKVNISGVLSLPNHADVNTTLSNALSDVSDLNTKTAMISTSTDTLNIDSKIDVNGFESHTFSGARFLPDGRTHTGTMSGNNYGALIIGHCQADAFVATSSKKIKNVESSLSDVSTENEALELFESIPLSKYSYIDQVKNNSEKNYGLIAEDMPNDIYRYDSNGFIPNIYQKGKVSFDQEKYTIKFTKALDFTKFENEDMSKIICFMFDKDENEKVKNCKIDLCNVEIIDEYNIRGEFDFDKFCCGHQEDIFVYGVRGTIPSVKKEAYFELTSCVVKHLIKENKELKERLNKIEEVLNIN
jgi:hypothetical protein